MPDRAEIAHEGDSDEGAWLYATSYGVSIDTRCEGGQHPIGNGLTAPWPDVLDRAPPDTLVAALARRPGVATRVMGPDTTIHAEVVTITPHRMDRDRETVTGPCTVIVVSPEGT